MVSSFPALAPTGIISFSQSGIAAGCVWNIMLSPATNDPLKAADRNVKYGRLKSGLTGSRSVERLPVPSAPTVSPDILKSVELVNVSV